MEIDFKVKINSDEVRQTLYANAAFAGALGLSIVLIGLYLKDLWPILAIAGAPLLWQCFSGYRNIYNQYRNPDVLRLENRALLYLKNQKEILRIPFSAVRAVQYREGLAFYLKRGERLELLDPLFQISSLKKKDCDLLFEWFDPSVKTSLDNIMHPNQSHHHLFL